MSIRQALVQRDVVAGLLFLATGLAVVAIAGRYPLGTAMRMGPGYFPTLLGGLLALLGACITCKGLRCDRTLGHLRLEPPSWRPPLLISGSVLLFAGAIQSLGLAIAALAVTAVSGIAHSEFRWRELALTSVSLSVFVVAVFAYGLRLPLRVWPI